MKIFTRPIMNTNQKPPVVYLDYLKELDCRIESLNQYVNWTNPNWRILNNKSGNNYFATDKELVNNGIIKIGLIDDDTSKSFTTITIICAAKLRLHQGLAQRYGAECYYWFFSDYDWPVRMSFDEISDETKRAAIKNKYANLVGINAQEVQDADLSKCEIWCASSSYIYTDKVVLSDSADKLYDSILYPDTIYVLQNNTSSLLYFNHSDTPIKNPYQLILAAQGYNIFCNYIEENDSQNLNNIGRQQIAHYQILPISTAGDMVIPTSQFDNNKWLWQYVPQSASKYGTEYIFHLPSSPLRLYYHDYESSHQLQGLYSLNFYQASNYLNSFNLLGNNITPVLANRYGTTWSGWNDHTLFSKIICNISTDTNIFKEEEIICDDSLSMGDTVFANYKIPYYNITIENMVEEDSFKPDMQWYLNIV